MWCVSYVSIHFLLRPRNFDKSYHFYDIKIHEKGDTRVKVYTFRKALETENMQVKLCKCTVEVLLQTLSRDLNF